MFARAQTHTLTHYTYTDDGRNVVIKVGEKECQASAGDMDVFSAGDMDVFLGRKMPTKVPILPPNKLSKMNDESEVRKRFKQYDEARSGTLSAAQLKELCKELGSELDDDELMAAMDW